MRTLNFIGRGSAFNVDEINTSAYIIEGKDIIIFDCGESVFSKMPKILNGNFERINIFITHLHSDHIGSLSTLIFYCWFKLNKKINIYYREIKTIKLLLQFQGVEEKMYNLYTDSEVSIGSIDIKSIPVNHCNEILSYAYILDCRENKIYYSGDSNDLSFYKSHNIVEENILCYQDTSLLDYPGNVHCSLKKLRQEIDVKYRKNIYCMHLDCKELEEKALLAGFNVVRIEN